MEINQIKQQLTKVDQIINRATQAINDDIAAPQELKDYVQQLDVQSKQARQTLKHSKDEEALLQCIDQMEETSDLAKKVSEDSRSLGAQAKVAVGQVHRQLSDLKLQLH